MSETGRAADRLPAVAPRSRLPGFVAVSVGVHGAAALAVLLWWLPPSQPQEVAATIQVLFGDNADVAGAPAPMSGVPTQAAATPSAAAAPAAPASDGEVAPPATTQPATVGGPPAQRPAASLPVRLGEGDIGLKLTEPPDAGLIEAQGDPGNRAPKYPDTAWLQRQRGRVVIRMHIDTEGRVAQVEVLESSGHPALDRAAREALSLWHFIPALRDGVAVPSFRDQATNFVLE